MEHAEYLKKYGVESQLHKIIQEVIQEVMHEDSWRQDIQTLRDSIPALVYTHNISARDIMLVLDVFVRLADRGVRPENVLRLFYKREHNENRGK